MSFNAQAVNALSDAIISKLHTLGVFEDVTNHEPKSAPGGGTHAAVWASGIDPLARASGLAATSGTVTFNIRIYVNFLQMPLDQIDPDLMSATSTVLDAFSGSFTLGGTVRNIDLFSTSARAGYLEISGKMYRIMTITMPVIINDMWTQVA